MLTQNQKSAMSASEIEEKMKKLRNYEDVKSFLNELVAPTLQGLLEAELENHLGYPKYQSNDPNRDNSRNGYRKKTVKTTDGNLDLVIPRDRNGTFESSSYTTI